jgi:bifunctional isochorismate lyase/aryl carrier protein
MANLSYLPGTWWRDLITEDSPLSRLSDKLSTQEAILVVKSQYDAFFNTELERILAERGVSHVVICGVMTHLCCETTARSAFMRGFDVWFTIDGTATYNEDFHMATLLNLTHGFSTPVLVSEVLTALQDDG